MYSCSNVSHETENWPLIFHVKSYSEQKICRESCDWLIIIPSSSANLADITNIPCRTYLWSTHVCMTSDFFFFFFDWIDYFACENSKVLIRKSCAGGCGASCRLIYLLFLPTCQNTCNEMRKKFQSVVNNKLFVQKFELEKNYSRSRIEPKRMRNTHSRRKYEHTQLESD